MRGVTRRSFMKGTIAVGAAAAMSRRVLGSNDDIRVGVVGINGRGGTHIREFDGMDGVRVTALCDVDRKVLESKARRRDVQRYVDVRKLIDNDDIDVVSIATPNHTHSLITYWACQAKKDVYVEKPLSHNVFEGRKIVEAARKYKCIVQHGTQSRSDGKWARMTAAARSGKYGKLVVAKGYCCKPRWTIGWKPLETPPKQLDFNLWLGPAPLQSYHKNLVHYNWHWFFDFGNGDMGNQGVHQMDLARWGIEGGTLPKSVVSLGGRYVNEPGFKDQGETPNQIVSIFDYGHCLLLFETRGLVGKGNFGPIVDAEFYTENGLIKGGRFYPKGSNQGQGLEVDSHVQPGGNFRNFIVCVRSRKHSELNADILEGHLSSALCHLGNISYRMGVGKKFEKPKDLGDNEVVGASIMTMLENTASIGCNPENSILRVGPKLSFNAEKEKFVDNPGADLLLRRDYREPFVIPQSV